MMIPRLRTLTLLPVVAMGVASAQTWLDFDASRSRDSLVLAPSPLEVTQVGDVQDSTSHLVFGEGYYEVLGLPVPTNGPWYVQTRFRLDDYGDSESWHIASIAGTATWPYMDEGDLPTQGFELRVGGGRFYPQIADNDLVSRESQLGARDYFTDMRNALYSTCLLELVTGTRDASITWSEAYSSRCVDKGVWHHVAAGWDGKRMVLFLDGRNVLDTNRMIGKGLAPRLDSPAQLYMGHRRRAQYDHRYFHGAVQSLRMVSGVLDSSLADRLHRQMFPAVQGTCAAVPVVDYPLTFQFAFANEIARMSLARSPKCAEGEDADLRLHPGDSIDVMAVAADGSGQQLGLATVGSLEFPLSKLRIEVGDSSLALRLKVRLRRSPVAGRAAAATVPEWNDNRPMVITGKALGARQAMIRGTSARLLPGHRADFPGVARLRARDVEGRRIELGLDAKSGTVWDLSSLPRGVWILSGGDAQLRYVRL